VDTVLRVVYIYFLLMVAFRVMGKHELSELSPFQLVTLLLIPEIFSDALARNDFSMTNATVAVGTLLGLVLLTSVLCFRFPRLERAMQGDATVIVREGRFVPDNMKRELVTPADVFTEMHKSGLEELRQVRWAILEVDGKISIIPTEGHDVIESDDDREPA
jgi:uncharacterized membrane protein YcaP (DUF421 family)